MKIPKHVQKYIEGELFNYPSNRRALDYEKQNIYLKSNINSYMVLPQQTRHATSVVEQKVVCLLSDRNIICMEKSVKSIEDMLYLLPEEQRQLIELRYFKAFSTERVAGELNICIRNFFRWRNKAFKLFAIRFGLI